MVGYMVLAVIIVFIMIVLVRAVLFNPHREPEFLAGEILVDEDKVIKDMIDMIRCKTVSNLDMSKIDTDEYVKFHELLKERFPMVHEMCNLEKIGDTGLLYLLKGEKNTEPAVLMAHYDVVPAEEKDWDKPAFEGLVEDGFIWGRGTLDTKGTVCGIFEALEQLLKEGFVPGNDLYLSFS